MSTQHSLADTVAFQMPKERDRVFPAGSESTAVAPETKINGIGAPATPKRTIDSRQAVVVYGVVGMLTWVTVFGIGMIIDSKPYREQVAKNFDFVSLVKATVTFTPTNVALLAMLAGFLGGCASLLMYSDYDPSRSARQNGNSPIDEERLAYLRENPISSALRGFLVYLTFLAGTVFSANGAFGATTQDQYCRLAGAVAVLAFSVGYDPTVFRGVLSLVTRGAKSSQAKSESDRPTVRETIK